MALTSVWSLSSLELGGNYLEPGGNDKNGGKNLVALYQPQRQCSHVPRSNLTLFVAFFLYK